MPDYSKCIIYTIRTPNGLYVGATCNFINRKYEHKSCIHNENSRTYNRNLYKNIRDNNDEWEMKPYSEFPCKNKMEMNIEEERIRRELNADLNIRSCYGFDKEKKKEYQQNNKEKIAEQRKEHYQNNKEKIAVYQKEYQQKNKKKVCEWEKRYRENNKEKIAERKKEHYQNNKEKNAEKNRQYRENNKEKFIEYKKQYQQENKEKIAERKKEYYQNNKEKLAEYHKQYYQKKKAEKLALTT